MKFGYQYAADVRELRAQGVEFAGAADGYVLADAANWSSGQKAAVTRAINQFDFSAFDAAQEKARSEAAVQGWITRRRKAKPKRKPRAKPTRKPRAKPRAKPTRIEFAPGASGAGLSDSEIDDYFEDSAGDEYEEWDDLSYFDENEADDLMDEESDDYEETD